MKYILNAYINICLPDKPRSKNAFFFFFNLSKSMHNCCQICLELKIQFCFMFYSASTAKRHKYIFLILREEKTF